MAKKKKYVRCMGLASGHLGVWAFGHLGLWASGHDSLLGNIKIQKQQNVIPKTDQPSQNEFFLDILPTPRP